MRNVNNRNTYVRKTRSKYNTQSTWQHDTQDIEDSRKLTKVEL
jgi:hypothetical protein